MKTHLLSFVASRLVIVSFVISALGSLAACQQESVVPQSDHVHMNFQTPNLDTINHQLPRPVAPADGSSEVDLPVIHPQPDQPKDF